MTPMFKNVELLGEVKDEVLININAVAAFVPTFDGNGIWTGTEARMIDGKTLRINLSLEEIADLISGLGDR